MLFKSNVKHAVRRSFTRRLNTVYQFINQSLCSVCFGTSVQLGRVSPCVSVLSVDSKPNDWHSVYNCSISYQNKHHLVLSFIKNDIWANPEMVVFEAHSWNFFKRDDVGILYKEYHWKKDCLLEWYVLNNKGIMH